MTAIEEMDKEELERARKEHDSLTMEEFKKLCQQKSKLHGELIGKMDTATFLAFLHYKEMHDRIDSHQRAGRFIMGYNAGKVAAGEAGILASPKKVCIVSEQTEIDELEAGA